MKVQLIVFSMFLILGLLFLMAPKFRKKEQEKSKREIEYFETLKAYKNTNDSQALAKLKELAKTLYHLNDEESEQRVEQDLNFMRP